MINIYEKQESRVSYDQDRYIWSQYMSELILQKRFSDLSADDLEHLSQDIHETGKQRLFALSQHMTQLIQDMLRWHFVTDDILDMYELTRLSLSIYASISSIKNTVLDIPSLNDTLYLNSEWYRLTWWNAEHSISNELPYIPGDPMSAKPLWTVEQMMEHNFRPKRPPSTYGDDDDDEEYHHSCKPEALGEKMEA